MIHELRVYQPLPGKMAKLQNRFSDQLLSIWDRHGIRPVGFWTTLLGESSNELTYILAWESLADRERKWTAFQEDPAWDKVRDESERDGQIVATISSQILTPTAFAATLDSSRLSSDCSRLRPRRHPTPFKTAHIKLCKKLARSCFAPI